MMTTQPPRIGRPFAPVKDGERVTLGLRVSANTKRQLEDEANKTGRSLSQEAELRVQQSFDSEEREKKLDVRDEKLIERVEDVVKKRDEELEKIWREVAETKKRLLDLIALSQKEDTGGDREK
jgi:hypothetical protein